MDVGRSVEAGNHGYQIITGRVWGREGWLAVLIKNVLCRYA